MPSSKDAVRQVAYGHDDAFNKGERELVEWQFRTALGMTHDDGFRFKLMEVIAKADMLNLSRLQLGFPEHVMAFRAYAHGQDDLLDRLEKVGVCF